MSDERRDQILNHPKAKAKPRLAMYLATHCTQLPAAVAISALSAAQRDLGDSSDPKPDTEEQQRAAVAGLGESIFERRSRQAQARPDFSAPNAGETRSREPSTDRLPEAEAVFAARRRGGAA
ncbi:MAG: hypothetical protein RIC56_03800 [Pseudomonadales bacterium]